MPVLRSRELNDGAGRSAAKSPQDKAVAAIEKSHPANGMAPDEQIRCLALKGNRPIGNGPTPG